jgi:hypothetical protein
LNLVHDDSDYLPRLHAGASDFNRSPLAHILLLGGIAATERRGYRSEITGEETSLRLTFAERTTVFGI